MKIEGTYFLEDDTGLIVSFDYRPETDPVMYLRNGDPGYPGDAAEVDDLVAKYEDGRTFVSTDSEVWKNIFDWAYEYGSENWKDWSDDYDDVDDYF